MLCHDDRDGDGGGGGAGGGGDDDDNVSYHSTLKIMH